MQSVTRDHRNFGFLTFFIFFLHCLPSDVAWFPRVNIVRGRRGRSDHLPGSPSIGVGDRSHDRLTLLPFRRTRS